MGASLYNVVLESDLSKEEELEQLLCSIKSRLALSDTELTKADVKRFGKNNAIVIRKAVPLNKAQLVQSQLHALSASCTVSVVRSPGKNKTQRTLVEKKPTRYHPLTEQDLDIEFLSVLPPLQHESTFKRSVYLTAPLMLMLPLLYLSFISATIAGLYWHTIENANLLQEQPIFLYTLFYITPIIAGALIIFFIAKPLIAKPASRCSSAPLNSKKNSLFLAYINKIADKVDSSKPTQVQITLEPKVELSVIGGLSGLIQNRFRLTVGLPLIAQLNSQQLTSLIAREFAFYNHNAEKRLVWIIRSIHSWFYQAWKQPDAWDVTLVNLKQTQNAKLIQLLVTEAQSIVKITRKILGTFYRLAHWIALPVLHKLYFRADEINSYLCGVNAIRSGEAHLHFLGYAFERCQQSINITAKALDKDLSKTISDLSKAIAKEQSQLDKEKKLPLIAIDAPPWRERLKKLKKANTTALYQQKYSAQSILPNFNELSEWVTRNYYTDYCKIDISTTTWNRAGKRNSLDNNPLTNYFNHLFRHENILAPEWLEEEFGSSLTLKQELQASINQLRQALPDWKKTVEGLDKINEAMMTAQLEQETESSTSKTFQSKCIAIDNLKQTQSGLLVELNTYDNIINHRLGLGLSYYSALTNYQNKDYLSQSVGLLKALKDLYPCQQSLWVHSNVLHQLLLTPEELRDLRFTTQLKRCTTHCGQSIAEIYRALTQYSNHEFVNTLLKKFGSDDDLNNKNNRKDPGNYLNKARVTLETYRELHTNIAGELVNICIEMEQKLAITPLRVTLK